MLQVARSRRWQLFEVKVFRRYVNLVMFFLPSFFLLCFLLHQKRSGDPSPQYFSKSTAVQMGGVLQYKWEAYCGVSLSSKLRFLRSQESTAIQMGGVLPYRLEVYCRTFQTSCRGWGFLNSCPLLPCFCLFLSVPCLFAFVHEKNNIKTSN